ncbi:hypothetical protein FNV43_RR12875 [Rhamnella rubrinervis]|uniref:O-methyltransferase n=1 Tax=Rhamnella rubrinervis TaxID=2594499 RepID=A0A8K0MD69_9ROSA|nr:hypothetical protein FNV43_RR12875 [Rhamnella rubrinervis]
MEESKSLRVVNKDLVVEENATELLEAQAHIFSHIYSYVNSGALKCAAKLGILETIHSHGKPMPLSHLVSSLPVHHSKAPFVYRIMRILVHAGFFRLEKIDGEEEGYVLTLASKLLLKDNPFTMAPFLPVILHPILTSLWDPLSTWFQNDDPTPFDTAHGMKFWDYTVLHPDISQKFNESMASDARLATRMVIERCKGVFEGLESLVDVGGGTGTMAKAIAKEFPSMECTVFDQPHVVCRFAGKQQLEICWRTCSTPFLQQRLFC